jgi:hypothetical protein
MDLFCWASRVLLILLCERFLLGSFLFAFFVDLPLVLVPSVAPRPFTWLCGNAMIHTPIEDALVESFPHCFKKRAIKRPRAAG